MNKRIAVITLLSGMAISMLIIIITVANTARGQKNKSDILAQESVITETQPAVIGYYLKEYNGELAVFRGESETPFKKLGVSLNLMSDYDKRLLSQGIFAEDEKALNMLIEDYTS